MGHYVGVDVGLRSTSLCIIDDKSKVCLEREVVSEIDELAASIRGFAEHVDGVALETGNLTPWLTAGLRAEGFRVVVMDARQVKTTRNLGSRFVRAKRSFLHNSCSDPKFVTSRALELHN